MNRENLENPANPVLVISARDNVATALEPLEAGRSFVVDGMELTASQRIPRGHKIALRSIRAGEPVMKYGNPIGTAMTEITAGEHVHVHNVSSSRGRGDLAQTPPSAPRLAEPVDGDAVDVESV
jgi:altronate dehydratase